MHIAFRFMIAAALLWGATNGHLYAQRITAAENPIFNGERKFTAGIALGGNLSQIDGDNFNGYTKFGINVGPVLNINFSEKVALGFELLYSQKGSSSVSAGYSSLGGSFFGKYKMQLNYAELPLVLYYNLQPKFQFGIGASYNVYISSKETYDDGMNPIITYSQEDYPFKKSFVDGLISASVVVYNGLVFQVRYQYSITSLRSYQDTPAPFSLGDQKDNMFAVRFMYLF